MNCYSFRLIWSSLFQPRFFHEFVNTVNLDIQQLGNIEFSFDSLGSVRSRTGTFSLLATYSLASLIRMPLAISIRATRSPAARIPPIPEAMA